MQSVINVEFTAGSGEKRFREESVSLSSIDELLAYIMPGGQCEQINDEVDEIQMVFLQPAQDSTDNPLANRRVTLELGMVFITGPLTEVIKTSEKLIERSERGEISASFMKMIDLNLT